MEPACSRVTVGHRIYRTHHDVAAMARAQGQRSAAARGPVDDDDTADLDERVRWDDNAGLHVARIVVSKAIAGQVIGKKGATVKKLSADCGCDVRVQAEGAGGKDAAYQVVIIKAESAKAVSSCCTRVDLLLEQASSTMPFTHFISVPLALIPSVVVLRAELAGIEARGWHSSVLNDLKQMHLTLCMLRLYTRAQVEAATAVLRAEAQAVYDMVGTRTLMVHLQGLEIMGDDPSETHVLYMDVAKDEAAAALLKITAHLISKLRAAGVGIETGDDDDDDTDGGSPEDNPEAHARRAALQRDVVKLHATIANSRFRRGNGPREAFDARGILAQFGAMDFGAHRVGELHLSRRGAYDQETGYYVSEARLHLP